MLSWPYSTWQKRWYCKTWQAFLIMLVKPLVAIPCRSRILQLSLVEHQVCFTGLHEEDVPPLLVIERWLHDHTP